MPKQFIYFQHQQTWLDHISEIKIMQEVSQADRQLMWPSYGEEAMEQAVVFEVAFLG